jgi:hypothetical protein
VKVRIIEVEWINRYIRDFYKFLAVKNDPVIYDNEVIKVLLSVE